jgi:hypothetical protein
MKWIIDASRYQRFTRAQWHTLKDNGCSGAIFKGGQGLTIEDPMLETHVNNSEAVGLPYSIYFWPDPILDDPAGQVEYCLSITSKYSPRFLAPDTEQWWANWALWLRARNGERVKVPYFSPSSLLSFYSRFLDKARLVSPMPLVLYSARWFINDWCPGLATYANSMPYWNARYYPWIDLDNDKIADWSEFKSFIATVKPAAEDLPKGVNDWAIWQVGEIPFEGLPVTDANVISDAWFHSLFENGLAPSKPVTKPLGYFKTRGKMNVRSAPSAQTGVVIGNVPKGTTLTALRFDGADSWIEYEPGKWVCLRLGKETYLDRV